MAGAAWKFANSVDAVPSLTAIPNGVWLALGVVEFFLAIGLVIGFKKQFGWLVPLAALGVVLEMLAFCAIHWASGDPNNFQMYYWLVVAAICAFIAYGRTKLKPL